MAISEDSTAVLERIEAVKRELQSLTVVTKEDVRARNSLLTVSQQTTADLESGFNSTWRLLMQVTRPSFVHAVSPVHNAAWFWRLLLSL